VGAFADETLAADRMLWIFLALVGETARRALKGLVAVGKPQDK
jgi:hypothetical protein